MSDSDYESGSESDDSLDCNNNTSSEQLQNENPQNVIDNDMAH